MKPETEAQRMARLDREATHRGAAPKTRNQNLAKYRAEVDSPLTRESTVEAYFCAQVLAAGGMTRKMEWVGRGGAPDRYASLPSVGPVFVELKRPGKDAEAHQAREHGRMHDAGSRVLVLDTHAKVDAFIKEHTAMDDDAIIARLQTGQSMFEKALLALITRLQQENAALKQHPPGDVYVQEPLC